MGQPLGGTAALGWSSQDKRQGHRRQAAEFTGEKTQVSKGARRKQARHRKGLSFREQTRRQGQKLSHTSCGR